MGVGSLDLWIFNKAFELFENLLHDIRFDVIRFLARVQFQLKEDPAEMERRQREREARARENLQYEKAADSAMGGESEAPQEAAPQAPFVRKERKVGRNEPCPCGSGKKYKACHGKLG